VPPKPVFTEPVMSSDKSKEK